MGLILAAAGAIGGNLGDQWLDAIEAQDMGEGVVFCKGAKLRSDDRRSHNRRGTTDVISNGSKIHVYDRQAMMLVDGGRITEFSAEPGLYTVDSSMVPSMFAGGLGASVKDAWERFKFGGGTPTKQQAFFVNLQEIKGIRFGTPSALNYFDSFYNAELFLRCHGTFSLKISNPILFYQEVVPRDATTVHIDQIKEQYLSEFLEALQASINQMSVDGIRISQVPSKMRELSAYMRDTLDADWLQMRGMEVCSVGIASITYDEESRKLIDVRNQGAMLSDAAVREGYVQGAVARGLEAAGSNPGGAGVAFMGMGVGMQAGGGFMQAASQSNQAQMAAQQAGPGGQAGGYGTVPQAGQTGPVPQAGPGGQGAAPQAGPGGGSWTCPTCQTTSSGRFCPGCGNARPADPAGGAAFCPNCGNRFEGARPRFCPQCGSPQS